ncbi:MAG: hypothetical protein JNM56_19750 [Planctomycetia bacterium]|nr:hypothetical protein [Planctomycetia bacterium]
MLECQSLRLTPGTQAADAPRWSILNAVDGKLLGVARRRTPPPSFWFAGRKRPLLEVVEGADESLLFTLTPGWGQGWLVDDAEGQRVGSVRAQLARDGGGERLARFEPSTDGQSGRWLAVDGQELAATRRDGQTVEVSFAPIIQDQPFVKMLLLAMLLRETG